MSADPKDEHDLAPAARLVPRKLSLRVSGTRVGDAARPAPSRAAAVGPRPSPRFGLRVHARFGVIPQVLPPVPDDEGGAP